MRALASLVALALLAPTAALAAEPSGGLAVPPSGGLAAPVPEERVRPARPPSAVPPAAASDPAAPAPAPRARPAQAPPPPADSAQTQDLNVQVPVPDEEGPDLPAGPAAEDDPTVGLAQTGFELAPLLGAGLALMAAGLVLLHVARRRPSH